MIELNSNENPISTWINLNDEFNLIELNWKSNIVVSALTTRRRRIRRIRRRIRRRRRRRRRRGGDDKDEEKRKKRKSIATGWENRRCRRREKSIDSDRLFGIISVHHLLSVAIFKREQEEQKDACHFVAIVTPLWRNYDAIVTPFWMLFTALASSFVVHLADVDVDVVDWIGKRHSKCSGTALKLLWNLQSWNLKMSWLKLLGNSSGTALKLLPRCNCSDIALKLHRKSLWNCSVIAWKLIYKQLWNCSETAPEMHWNCTENALSACSIIARLLLWNCSRTALKQLWKCTENRYKLI